MQQTPVSDLMRDCSAAVIPANARLRDAAQILIQQDLAVLIATDTDGKIHGLVAEAAVIRHLMSHPGHDVTVEPILSRHVESVRVDTDVNKVLHLFRSACHTVIPVVDADDVVVGMLHRGDIVRALLSEAGSEQTEDQPQTRNAPPRPHMLDPRKPREDANSDGEAGSWMQGLD